MDIYFGAYNTTIALQGTIIQTDWIFVAANIYLAILFYKNKTVPNTRQHYPTEWCTCQLLKNTDMSFY